MKIIDARERKKYRANIWYCQNIKFKNIFTKVYTPNWSEEVFVIKKLKILCHIHML